MKFLLVTYSNKVKSYCQNEFYSNLYKISKGNPVMVVINSDSGEEYTDEVRGLTYNYPNFTIYHLAVPKDPYRTLFLRNVCESVSLCRDEFLRSDAEHMIIVESDVLPPLNLLDRLEEDALYLTGEKWGIIGALYYQGIHDFEAQGLHPTRHVLSGCTMYNRELLKESPFRWSLDNLNAFPDAFQSMDCENKGYSMYNDHSLHCEHLFNKENGGRYSGTL